MSGQVKTIARILQAAGSAIQANGNLVLLNVENGHLVERIFDGEELKDQRLVVDGVKSGASAAFVVSDNHASHYFTPHALILYITDGGELRASEFDPDSEEWDDSELNGLDKIKVQEQSGLSAVTINESILVFYQAPDGTIKSIRHDQGTKTWKAGFSVPGAAETGTPIAAFNNKEALIVAFVEQDGTIHAHSRDFASGNWSETILPNSSFDDKIANLSVSQDITSGELDSYVLIGSTLHHVKKNGEQAVIGTFSNKEFVAATRAEDGDWYGNNYGNVNMGGRGGNGGGYGGGGYGGGYGGYRGYGGYIACPPPYRTQCGW